MVHRDPETGKFVADEDNDFDELIQLHGRNAYSVPAADLSGATGQILGESGSFEGDTILDYQDHLERTQFGVVLWQHVRVIAYISSTQTADGTVRFQAELSLDPDREAVGGYGTFSDLGDTSGDLTVEGSSISTPPAEGTDSPDLLGPIYTAVGFGPITDGTNGVGGAGTAGEMDWEGPIIHEPSVDDRDEVFVNGTLIHSNVSDAAIHGDIQVYQVVGIVETA